jgi:hypothetical protein
VSTAIASATVMEGASPIVLEAMLELEAGIFIQLKAGYLVEKSEGKEGLGFALDPRSFYTLFGWLDRSIGKKSHW